MSVLCDPICTQTQFSAARMPSAKASESTPCVGSRGENHGNDEYLT